MAIDISKNEHIKKSILKILDESSFWKLFFLSVEHLHPSGRRSAALIMLGGLLLYLFICSDTNNELITNFPLLIEKSNSIVLALLAIVITGYTIFQAMLSTPALKTFLSTDSNQKSVFSNYQHCFFILALLYIFILSFNYILISIFTVLPNVLNHFNEIVLKISSIIYIVFILNSFIEMKSFLYNFYQTLSISAIAKTLDDLRKEEKNT